MPVYSVVTCNSYQDSVRMMELTARLQRLPSLEGAAALMGTPANRALLAEAGLLTPEIETAGPADLCIAIRGADRAALEEAMAAVEAFLAERPPGGRGQGEPVPRSLGGGASLLPGANLALISVPGPYAAAEAWKALERDLHVFLFSDNVTLGAEVALKREAERRGLLLMGPDCGTALVGGVVLGFGNQVPAGPVGLVGASGTGLQEVSCLLARLGSGVSHALGTGSRDLAAAVGGSTTRAALRALMADPATRIVVWVSKPGDPAVTRSLLREFAYPPKPLVATLLGLEDLGALEAEHPGIRFARTMEAAAVLAVRGDSGGLGGLEGNLEVLDGDLEGCSPSASPRPPETRRLSPGQRALRGIFAGGTLAAEAAAILAPLIGPHEPAGAPPGAVLAHGSSRLVDYGDDAYTRGRAHPMIDPRVRQEAILAAGEDEMVGVVLFDVVLGFGAHEDPAGALAPAIEAATAAAQRRGGDLVFVGHVVGTDQDPQPYRAQRARLERSGVVVAASNAQAARYAAAVLQSRM